MKTFFLSVSYNWEIKGQTISQVIGRKAYSCLSVVGYKFQSGVFPETRTHHDRVEFLRALITIARRMGGEFKDNK